MRRNFVVGVINYSEFGQVAELGALGERHFNGQWTMDFSGL
jgi:hypothetical protein